MDPTELLVVQVSFMQWVCRCDAACAGSRPNRACFSVPGQENPPVLPSNPSPTWWCSASREPMIENPVRTTGLDLSYCTDLLCTFNNKKTTKQVDVTMFCIFTYCKKVLNASDCPLPHNQTTPSWWWNDFERWRNHRNSMRLLVNSLPHFILHETR